MRWVFGASAIEPRTPRRPVGYWPRSSQRWGPEVIKAVLAIQHRTTAMSNSDPYIRDKCHQQRRCRLSPWREAIGSGGGLHDAAHHARLRPTTATTVYALTCFDWLPRQFGRDA